ncbi:pyruvate, phosphate dikinase [Thermanaerovibrio velox DSM 12556]|uniref:Pyruvate, phosphate dikinase n=1 Tax=Thermanaerovibrio velox DSM 12556 TaxID=926567 RepID=H0URD5_9BACT|nr:pyruvate, phosphate dikinase [Thermanaerovibrio velox]EHM09891.1 pyruvate, phosphate dikinase [Thermanaerovibrio velox DSM 12556]
MSGEKWVYEYEHGSAEMKGLLGGKGANLAQMWNIGLPVPPGFIITTEACKAYWVDPRGLMDSVWPQVSDAVARLEERTGKVFGGERNPLLVSVRSGAPVSMPGMMDTILNLGLNETTVKALAEASGDERFAWDSYRRFIQMFSDVVLGLEIGEFEFLLSRAKGEQGCSYDHQLTADSLKKLVGQYLRLVESKGISFPTDPWDQLRSAVEAVFKSWNTPRAVTYRNIHKIPDDLGTAVCVVSMVYGNLGEDCGTGVCFTRDPSTGEKRLYGEFLVNAQGEDVVAGIRTPRPISDLKDAMPEVYSELVRLTDLLERHYRDMQDIEFTVERGKLYLLQTRNGKRTAKAAVKVAVDMVREGLISQEEAVKRVTPDQVEQLLHPQLDPSLKFDVLAKGLPASPGAAVGKVVFDADEAERMGKNGEDVILVRPETTPDDIHGLFAARGILTSHGGMTSHAAVVARGLGKPCVSGCEALDIDLAKGVMRVGGKEIRRHEVITIDGSRGLVAYGALPLVQPSFTEDFRELLSFADRVSKLEVWANADTPEDAERARGFGAKGIGLCRTEHMFMQADRLPVMQEMVASTDRDERLEALGKLKVMQKEDFVGIFKAMEGLPVTVRLLDPPLHEFLPKVPEMTERLEELIAQGKGDSPEACKIRVLIQRAESLKEANPMLGFRGCRLGIIYPEIYEMQVEAIFEAVVELMRQGVEVYPDIMMPLVGTYEEMRRLREMVDRMAQRFEAELGRKIPYMVGTMIEVPRAALIAGDLAKEAEFFSFGTNDLTQTTFGYSRDDAEGKFLAEYVRMHILGDNPFHVLDRSGVGRLLEIAVSEGRAQREDIQIGICGEHGGNPKSIAFCHRLGLKYVSCSPFRVPVARLAAAHAAMGLID